MQRSTIVALFILALAAGLYVAFRDTDKADKTSVGISQQPCPAPLPLPIDLVNYRKALVTPGDGSLPTDGLRSKAVQIYRATAAERARQDWPNLCQYRQDNAQLLGTGAARPVAVFMGDSITENWQISNPAYFSETAFINRGIGGQTTPQMLLRFRADVIALNPQAVHILAGTNDIAGNTGATTLRDIQGNIESMVELALAHNIHVVIGSLLPAGSFPWRPEMEPIGPIAEMNNWLREYAEKRGLVYVDYFSALTNGIGGLKAELTHDGVHPHQSGYAFMEPLAQRAIERALEN